MTQPTDSQVEDKRGLLDQWERFAKAASDEKRWMNDRLTWLFASQAVFFGAYVFVLEHSQDSGNGKLTSIVLSNFLPVMIWIGFFSAFLTLVGVIAAGIMHWNWTSRLNGLAMEIHGTYSNFYGPEKPLITFGSPPYWPAGTSSVIPSLLAMTFLVPWIYVAALWSKMDAFSKGGIALSFLIFVLVVSGTLICVAGCCRTKYPTKWISWSKSSYAHDETS